MKKERKKKICFLLTIGAFRFMFALFISRFLCAAFFFSHIVGRRKWIYRNKEIYRVLTVNEIQKKRNKKEKKKQMEIYRNLCGCHMWRSSVDFLSLISIENHRLNKFACTIPIYGVAKNLSQSHQQQCVLVKGGENQSKWNSIWNQHEYWNWIWTFALCWPFCSYNAKCLRFVSVSASHEWNR